MTIVKSLPATQWKMKDAGDKEIENVLSKEFALHPIITQILAGRAINNMEDARRYLNPSLNDLHSPFLMKDMKDRYFARFASHFRK